MNEPITLPTLSDTMETGRLAEWLKQPGDPIKKGDVLAEVETDKAVMDVEAFHDGYLVGPLAATGTDIPVGAVIGYVGDSPQQAQAEQGAAPDETRVEKTAISPTEKEIEKEDTENKSAIESPPEEHKVIDEKPAATETYAAAVPETPVPTPAGGNGVKASPYALGLAHELGIDLHQVSAASDGVIHAPQVLAAALAGPAPNLDAGPAYRYKFFTPMHKAVADNMIATLGTPTFRVSARLSLAPLKAMAHEQQQSLSLLLARACAQCVQQHPQFNAVYTPRALVERKQVDVGIAVDVPGGLLTPVVRDAARRPLDELAEDWRILRDKIKRNRLAPDDYQGATFYLSNLGVFEQVSHFDALVPPGAAAILALGAEHEGKAEFTLSCDHRVVFGADAARFLASLSQLLDEPQGILIDANKD